MRMKVFDKGQVVIPAEIRKRLEIAAGDSLEVTVDESTGAILLRKARESASALAPKQANLGGLCGKKSSKSSKCPLFYGVSWCCTKKPRLHGRRHFE